MCILVMADGKRAMCHPPRPVKAKNKTSLAFLVQPPLIQNLHEQNNLSTFTILFNL